MEEEIRNEIKGVIREKRGGDSGNCGRRDKGCDKEDDVKERRGAVEEEIRDVIKKVM